MTSKFTIVFFFLLLICGCKKTTYPSFIESILINSKENRKELEFTLDYFSKRNDSLKEKALYFLLKNINKHYSYNPAKFLNNNHKKAFNLLNETAKKQYVLNFNNVKHSKRIYLKKTEG